eukprot:TRINITY_DN40701_c0_g1_i1.p1 TRINITY_DN40701_c0_g1~~TRINITY_DN40701_c0_g1_i1.p1  ORF type:complete len:483 (-),score=89.78 TRINITY_DN40701_c0_g1_i1:45-1493(-)
MISERAHDNVEVSDDWLEPAAALKIGPFACFCLCKQSSQRGHPQGSGGGCASDTSPVAFLYTKNCQKELLPPSADRQPSRRSNSSRNEKFLFSDGTSYEGQIESGKKHGFGKYIFNTGSTYEGQWVDDSREGTGVEKFSDSSIYEGDFSNGEKHGQGKFTMSNGCVYEGQIHMNEMHGDGTYQYCDGRIYQGQWRQNHMGPRGKMHWSDGRCYEGEFLSSQRHGRGRMSWPDGRAYAGQWNRGKQNGKGMTTTVQGREQASEWENGIFVRWLEEPLAPSEIAFEGVGASASTCSSAKVAVAAAMAGARDAETPAEEEPRHDPLPAGRVNVLSPFARAISSRADGSKILNGCTFEFDDRAAEKSGSLPKDDPILDNYKKGGFFGTVTSAFGDKKTMFCHHLTAQGEFATKAARAASTTFTSADDVWAFIGKEPCIGSFVYDWKTGRLKCGELAEHSQDATCNVETCLFIANNLPCPTPSWALK